MLPNYIARRPIDIPLRSHGASPILQGPSRLGNPLFKSSEGKNIIIANMKLEVRLNKEKNKIMLIYIYKKRGV